MSQVATVVPVVASHREVPVEASVDYSTTLHANMLHVRHQTTCAAMPMLCTAGRFCCVWYAQLLRTMLCVLMRAGHAVLAPLSWSLRNWIRRHNTLLSVVLRCCC